jgi:hypothetical protein
MVQNWIKCCSDASICCTQHLREEKIAVPDHQRLHASEPNAIPQHLTDKQKGGVQHEHGIENKWSSKFTTPSAQSLYSWDITSVSVGEEDLKITPASLVKSSDGSDLAIGDLPDSSAQTSSSKILHCPRTWDGWTCWKDNVDIGVTVEQPCPDHIYWKIAAPPCRGSYCAVSL